MRTKLATALSTIALVITALFGAFSVINTASSAPDNSSAMIDTGQ